jgi:ribosomal protein S18 acetylase RimI-like enzyme
MMAEITPSIRAATPADAPALADLQVWAWQWAYRGQLPDAVLDGLPADLDRRAAFWRESFATPASDRRTWLVEVAGRLVGFADTGPCRDADAPPATAELNAIYLDPAAIGLGIGRALLAHAMDDLRQRGYRAATLWVLATNARARRFYTAAGWHADGAAKMEQSQAGVVLEEVRYAINLAGADG